MQKLLKGTKMITKTVDSNSINNSNPGLLLNNPSTQAYLLRSQILADDEMRRYDISQGAPLSKLQELDQDMANKCDQLLNLYRSVNLQGQPESVKKYFKEATNDIETMRDQMNNAAAATNPEDEASYAYSGEVPFEDHVVSMSSDWSTLQTEYPDVSDAIQSGAALTPAQQQEFVSWLNKHPVEALLAGSNPN